MIRQTFRSLLTFFFFFDDRDLLHSIATVFYAIDRLDSLALSNRVSTHDGDDYDDDE